MLTELLVEHEEILFYCLGNFNRCRFYRDLTKGHSTSRVERYRKVVERYPPIVYGNRSSLLEAMTSSQRLHLVLPSSALFARFAVGQYCQLTFAYDAAFYSQSGGFAFRKGSPWPRMLRKPAIAQYSMHNYLTGHSSESNSSCLRKHTDEASMTTTQKAMNLYSIFGAFLFLLLGLSLALVRIFVKWHQRPRT